MNSISSFTVNNTGTQIAQKERQRPPASLIASITAKAKSLIDNVKSTISPIANKVSNLEEVRTASQCLVHTIGALKTLAAGQFRSSAVHSILSIGNGINSLIQYITPEDVLLLDMLSSPHRSVDMS